MPSRNYHFVPMDTNTAGQICKWIYDGEYSLYSFQENDDTIAELMCGEYYACSGADDLLTGYFCYGRSAQIPTVENGFD